MMSAPRECGACVAVVCLWLLLCFAIVLVSRLNSAARTQGKRAAEVIFEHYFSSPIRPLAVDPEFIHSFVNQCMKLKVLFRSARESLQSRVC